MDFKIGDEIIFDEKDKHMISLGIQGERGTISELSGYSGCFKVKFKNKNLDPHERVQFYKIEKFWYLEVHNRYFKKSYDNLEFDFGD